jgi:hypothetical protein
MTQFYRLRCWADFSQAHVHRLERWRTEGIGPKYLKLCGRVLYRLVDIEEYESACLMSSTGKAVAV